MSLDSILRATGKNLANCGEKADWYSPISDLTDLTVSEGIVSSPAVSAGSGMAINKNRVFTNGETFTFNAELTAQTVGNVTYRYVIKPYKNNTVIDNITIDGWTYNQYYKAYWASADPKSFIFPKDTVNSFEWGFAFLAYGDISAGTVLTYSNIQIEKGSTATTYEPYEYLGPKTIKIPSNGENLTPYPYAENDKTENGITFVTGYYSGIKMNGTVSSDLPMGFTIVDNLDLTAGDYTFSSGYNGTVIPNDVIVQLNYLEGTIPKEVVTLSGSKLQEIFSIDDTLAQKKFRAVIALNTEMSNSFSVNDLLLCPTLVKSGSKEVLKVSYNSRNLIPYPYFSNTITNNGVTYTVNANGSIKISGTASADNNSVFFIRSNTLPLTLKQGEQYTLSGHIEGSGITFSMQDSSLKQTISVTNTITSKSFTTLYSNYYMWLVVLKGTTVDTVVYPQLELGDKATDYVPYFNMTVWEKQEQMV